MAQDDDAPKGSSWHSWVRGSARRRSAPLRADVAPPPPPPAADDDVDDEPEDDLEVQLQWPGADEAAAGSDDGSDADDVAAVDLAGTDFDELAGDDAGADDDDDSDLLPAVPLLPTIAGRVDALGALLRTIAMRVDSLGATTNALRSSVTDRIDEYADLVAALGRQTDQNLDDYRRANERTVSELRRGLADHDELLHRLSARLDELGTDIASLVDMVRLAANEQRATPTGEAPVFVARDDPAPSREDRLALTAEIGALRADLSYVRDMLDIVVDTMPASAVGSAGGQLADADVDRIAARLAATIGGAAPAPAGDGDAAASAAEDADAEFAPEPAKPPARRRAKK